MNTSDKVIFENWSEKALNSSIRFFKDNTKKGLYAHWHEHLEMLFFTGGSCKITCGKSSFEVKSGEIAVINGREVHSFEKSDTGSYYCLQISSSYLSLLGFDGYIIDNHIPEEKDLCDAFNSLIYEKENMLPGCEIAYRAFVCTVLYQLIRKGYVSKLTKSEQSRRMKASKQIESILLYISENADKCISTASVAAKFYLNESYFCRFFKKYTGQSPVKYINRLKIEKACKLLNDTDMTVQEICESVGYIDYNYFGRIFKQFIGQSPNKYKKNILEKN